ncbi:MUM1 protein, partial [Centropus bengalensis]|nr:MUM1 protein [Centropus bengalensis]
SEVVEELKYRGSLKIALDILNQNGSARPVPASEEAANTPLLKNNTGSPSFRHRLLFRCKDKLEPETSKRERKSKNNSHLKTDAKKQERKGSSAVEESLKADGSGTSPSKCTGDLCEVLNLDRQNHRRPEPKLPSRKEKTKPRSVTKSKPEHKNSLKPKEGKSKQGGTSPGGAGSLVSCRNDFHEDQAQPGAEEGSLLSTPCEADPVKRMGTRRQPKRTSQGSSGPSALAGSEQPSSRGETEGTAKPLGGRKKPVSVKQIIGEQETGAAVCLGSERNSRNCPMRCLLLLAGLESADLSSEIVSSQNLHRLSPLVDEEEEDEELPSVLSHQEPQSIEEGVLVWCKLRQYPYWPAVVKRVIRKQRKAYVVFIEGTTSSKTKGFSVSLKNLKHFDCEEKQDFIEQAKENYRKEIEWCIRLISDYHIRVGCHSFTGSFLEYFAADISYPVRKEAFQGPAQLTFPNTAEEGTEESASDTSPQKPCKKLLPDRTRAARDKANKKIVEFIVKTKGAEEHLLSILKSKKQSRWLKKFLNSSQYVTCVETYLEDEEQLDLVVNYLKKVYSEIDTKNQHQIHGDGIKFISDVLLPEAIIYAISAVDDIDYKKAEEKYINGPSVSKR